MLSMRGEFIIIMKLTGDFHHLSLNLLAIQEQNIFIHIIIFKFLKANRSPMAYYFFLTSNTSLPTFYTPTFPYLQSIIPTSTYYNIGENHLNNNSVEQSLDRSLKNNLEVSTIISQEAVSRKGHQEKKKRRREKNIQRQLVSAKKNSQSNIINHFFAYFVTREYSQTLVRRIIASLKKGTQQSQKIVTIFYNIIRLINIKRGRKYINKSILYNHFTCEGLLQLIDNIRFLEGITMEEVAKILRKYFFDSHINIKANNQAVSRNSFNQKKKN